MLSRILRSPGPQYVLVKIIIMGRETVKTPSIVQRLLSFSNVNSSIAYYSLANKRAFITPYAL